MSMRLDLSIYYIIHLCIYIYKNIFIGLRAQMVYWALGLGQGYGNLRNNEWCWMDQA